MGITSVKYLEDRTIVRYSLQKPDGIPKEQGEKAVFHEGLEDLPDLYKFLGGCKKKNIGVSPFCVHNQNVEVVVIPKIKRMIFFVFDSYTEKPRGPDEEDIYGPFTIKGK